MRVQSRHLPEHMYSTVMEVVVAVVAAWACLLPLLAQPSATQGFTLQADDLLAGSVSELVRSGSTTASLCSTPDGQQGVCGSATTCPAYLPLLDHLRNATVLNFFRERVCRHSPGLVHVCCPLTPKAQSSSIFILSQGKASQSSSGSSLRPSQRPNARQPSQPGLRSDSDDEGNEEKEFLNTSPPQPTFQPTLQPSAPTQGQPLAFPQLPPVAQRTTTPATTTGVFRGPDREPPGRTPFTPTSLVPQNQDQPPAEPTEPQILPAEGECGTKAQDRTGSTPWVVGIGVLKEAEFRVNCGGALVSRLHVIAAAHCLQDPSPSHVRLGDPLRREHTEDVPLRTWTNANYDENARENDLALLTLARPVTFTDNIRPVCLPFRYRLDGFRGQVLEVVGWGGTGALETGKVEILGSRQCRAAYKSPDLVSNNNVGLFSGPSSSSASSSSAFISPRSPSAVTVDRRNLCGSPAPSAGSASCLSNYGAPIFFHDEETTGLHFLAGVSSLGDSCHAGPGIYTRIGAFLPWLSQELSRVEPPVPNSAPGHVSTRRQQSVGRNRG